MGVYNPQNMYRPAVAPDTQGLGPGIAGAGQAINGAIEQYASNRSAAKAADSEYDLFQQLYPGAAAMIDGEKFHSSNLAGKQKMLGMAKGYVLEQTQKDQANREMTLKELEMNLRQGELTQRMGYNNAQLQLSAQELEQRTANNAAQLQLSGQELGQKAAESASRDSYYDKKLSLEELEANTKAARLQAGVRKVTTPDGLYSFYEDRYGQRMPNLPTLQNLRGPFEGGLTKEVPVAVMKAAGKAGTTKTPPRVMVDTKPYYVRPDGVSVAPMKIIDPAQEEEEAKKQAAIDAAIEAAKNDPFNTHRYFGR